MKLFNTKGNTFCGDFCYSDIVSFVRGACKVEFSAHLVCTWVAKWHQISCWRQLYSSVEGFIIQSFLQDKAGLWVADDNLAI